jgi:hypothetical protein
VSIFDADPTWGAEATEGLIAVAAGELHEWAWLVGQLADWLATTAETTTADFHRHFGGSPTHQGALWALDHVAERITTLLNGNRGKP